MSYQKDNYVIVCWPDIQDFMVYPDFEDNSYLINDEKGLGRFGSSAYFVNCEWIEKIKNQAINFVAEEWKSRQK